jgi:hypothetical protein
MNTRPTTGKRNFRKRWMPRRKLPQGQRSASSQVAKLPSCQVARLPFATIHGDHEKSRHQPFG